MRLIHRHPGFARVCYSFLVLYFGTAFALLISPPELTSSTSFDVHREVLDWVSLVRPMQAWGILWLVSGLVLGWGMTRSDPELVWVRRGLRVGMMVSLLWLSFFCGAWIIGKLAGITAVSFNIFVAGIHIAAELEPFDNPASARLKPEKR